jgi:hypothetical protein
MSRRWLRCLFAACAFACAATATTTTAAAPSTEQPTGDFAHTPPAAQRSRTPLPLYFEYNGDQKIVRVTVKYEAPGTHEWRRLDLPRANNGWGGVIPCGDVTTGTVKYWVVGFDGNGDAVATSGDTRQPFSVPIREGAVAEAPHLPGRSPPRRCSPGGTEEATEGEGESTSDTGSAGEGTKPTKGDIERARGAPEDTARERASMEIAAYSDSDHVTVFTPSVNGAVDNTSGASLSGSYLVDVVSAASVDIVSTASQRWQEVRQAGELAGAYKPHDFGVSVGGSLSREPDYLSYGGYGTLTKDFDEKNWTLTFGYGYSHDTAGRCGADGVCTPFAVFSRQLERNSFNGGLAWVVDSATLASVSLDVVLEDGDQSKPYRYIPVFFPSVAASAPLGASIAWVNAYRLPERPLEQLPLELRRTALTGHYAHRFEGATLRLEERIYDDDWGLVASTTDARWIFDLGRRFELWPHTRFHAQSSVVFWRRAYVSGSSTGWDLPEYRTGDRELGPLWTFGAGLGLRAYLGSAGRPDQWALQFVWDGMYTSFLDDLYVTERTAILGSLTFLGEL